MGLPALFDGAPRRLDPVVPPSVASSLRDVAIPVVQATMLICGAVALGGGMSGARRRLGRLAALTGRDIPFLLAGLFFITLSACLTHAGLQAAGLLGTNTHKPAGLLATTLLLPLAHELLLRGTIQPRLGTRWGLSASIVATALIGTIAMPYGLTDIGWAGAALALAPGLLIGWTSASCRSVVAAGALHVAYAVALAALAR